MHCQTLGIRCECHGSSEMTIINGCPCHSRCGMLKNPNCSMILSAYHRSKFAALHRQWWRLHMSEKFSSGTINSKKTKTKPLLSLLLVLVLVCVTSTVSSNEEKRNDPSQSLRYPLTGIFILLITTNSSLNNNSLLSILMIQYQSKWKKKKPVKITYQ